MSASLIPATQPTRRSTRRGLLCRALSVLALGLAAISASPARAQILTAEPPKEIRGLEVSNHLGETLPLDLTFVNEKGDTIPLRSLFNKTASDGKTKKPVVMMMVYFRCPMLCPLVLEKFGAALGEIDFTVGKEYDVVVVSFDPRDTFKDAALQKKARVLSYGRDEDEQDAKLIEQGFSFLASSPENARTLGNALGFPYRQIPETGEFAHGACVFVLTPEGRISRYITGLNYPAKDVRLALLDASGGRIGSIFDAVTLWCYHYDPNSGGYTVQAMRLMRIGAAGMTLFVATLLIAMLRIEKSKKRRAAVATGIQPPKGPGSASSGRAVAAITGHTA